MAAKVDPWMPFRKPKPAARARLFCFPYAGGGASLYRTWGDELPADFEVVAVQIPGRENRFAEDPVAELLKLAGLAADALAPHLGLPFAFFGHSMGAMLAFEIARTLRKRGAAAPFHLFASACPAPHIPDTDQTHELPEAEVIEHMRKFGGMSDDVLANRELMELLLPVLRADAAVTETYVHAAGEPLACPITAYGGVVDAKVSEADLAAWKEHTRGAFTLTMFPGDHFYVKTARTELLAALSKALRAPR